jgi:hypothetical protein
MFELVWEIPSRAAETRRLVEFCRVIPFDKRGSGLSDRTLLARILALVPLGLLRSRRGDANRWAPLD